MRRLGCPETIARCHTNTQRNMIHSVKTSFGVSSGKIKWGLNENIVRTIIGTTCFLVANFGGIGQGGGGGPVIWLTIAMVLIQAYAKRETGAPVWDPKKEIGERIHVVSYVDDNTLVQEIENNATIEMILKQMQQCITRWRKLLQITGGDLSLPKCELAILKWTWFGGKAVAHTTKTLPGHIEIDHTKLQRKEIDKGYKMLGVRLTLNGTHKDELQYRVKQSKRMRDLLYRAPATPLDAMMIYNTRYLPAIKYPLSVIHFNNNELNSIQKPFIHLLLPKIGLNQHTPLAVIHAPLNRAGLNLPQLEHEQIVEHVKMLMGHIRRNDLLGRLYKVQIRTIQQELGTATFIFRQDPDKYNYITNDSKIVYLWKELYRREIQLALEEEWIPSPQYKNDICIMDTAVSIEKFQHSHDKLQRINACRKFLKVMWLSELTNEDGTIPHEYMNGKKQYNSATEYPHQECPDRYSWSIWRELMITHLLKFGNNNTLLP